MTHIKNLTAKTKAFVTVSVVAPVVLGFQQAFAAVYGGGGIQDGINQAAGLGGISNVTSVRDIIIRVITFILDIVLLLAVAAIIIAGIYLITSNGEEGQKDKAKRIIYYALIGIVVVLFSRMIVIFVNTIFA